MNNNRQIEQNLSNKQSACFDLSAMLEKQGEVRIENADTVFDAVVDLADETICFKAANSNIPHLK